MYFSYAARSLGFWALFGTVLGCLFAIYVDTIFAFVNYVSGGGVWDPSIRGIYEIPAELKLDDVITAVTLSLGLALGSPIFQHDVQHA